MKRLLSIVIVLLISAWFIGACGKNDTTQTTVHKSEGTADAPIDIQTNTETPHSGSVGNKAAGMSYYSVASMAGAEYTITLYGLSADADLLVYNDRPFDFILGPECTSKKGGTNIEICTVTAKDTTINIAVDGQYTASGATFYISANRPDTTNLSCSDPQCITFEDVTLPTGFTTSDPVWAIDSSESANGTRSVKSGGLANFDTSCISYSPTGQTSYVSFNMKVSSVKYNGLLLFYIDNVLQQPVWSGNVDWQRVVFNATPGTHTYKWCYSKNSASSDGTGSAWLDDVLIK